MPPIDLGKQVGPLPLGAWIVVVGGGLGIAWYSRRGAAEPTLVNDIGGVPGVGVGGGGYTFAPAQPLPATQPTETVPETNEEWGRIATNYLIQKGYDPISADNAVRKYLVSERLTLTEQMLISIVLARHGTPPQALPPTYEEAPLPAPAPPPPPVVEKPIVPPVLQKPWTPPIPKPLPVAAPPVLAPTRGVVSLPPITFTPPAPKTTWPTITYQPSLPTTNPQRAPAKAIVETIREVAQESARKARREEVREAARSDPMRGRTETTKTKSGGTSYRWVSKSERKARGR